MYMKCPFHEDFKELLRIDLSFQLLTIMSKSKTGFKKCAFCAYKSIRSFNVFRHEERIHRPKDRRIISCCNRRFLTKGEFYGHVEDKHPQTRKGYVSRMKYKITKRNLKVYKVKTEQAKSKIEKRPNRIKSIPVVERKRSIRIQMMKLKAISSGKSESKALDVNSRVVEEPVLLNFRKSSKRKFEEITDVFKDTEVINNLPLKKRILKQLEGNIPPVPEIRKPKKPKNNEKFQENIPPVYWITIRYDSKIMSPQTERTVAEFLRDISIEMFSQKLPL